MTNLGLKRTENWESGVLVEYIWGTFDLVVFKVILGVLVSIWTRDR